MAKINDYIAINKDEKTPNRRRSMYTAKNDGLSLGIIADNH